MQKLRLLYFFILLLRPSTIFFFNQLYDKVPREVSSWFFTITADYPKRGGEPIPIFQILNPFQYGWTRLPLPSMQLIVTDGTQRFQVLSDILAALHMMLDVMQFQMSRV